MNKQKVCEDN